MYPVLKQVAAGDTLTTGFVVGGASREAGFVACHRADSRARAVRYFGRDDRSQAGHYSGQTVINANDNWGGGGSLATAFANVGAFALTAGSRDAAILATLAPGSYTAQVSGVGGTGGMMLVEVYEVP